jgi:hypothetical protein
MTLLDNHPLKHITLEDSDRVGFVKTKDHGYMPVLGPGVPSLPSQTIRANINLLVAREQVGITKYGCTLDNAGLSHEQALQHLLEEQLDGANYIQASLRNLRNANQDYAVLRDRLAKLIPHVERLESYGRAGKASELLKSLLLRDDSDRVLRHLRA